MAIEYQGNSNGHCVAWEPVYISYNILEASLHTHLTGWDEIQSLRFLTLM